MNMTNVLHRRKTDGVHDTLPSAPDFVPPTLSPPEDDRDSPSSWPFGARVLVALLVVATLLSTVAAVIGFGSGDDEGSIERQLRARIDAVTAERDDALGDVAALDAELASLRDQLEQAQAGNDALTDDIAQLEARIATVTEERAAALATVVELTAARDEALADADDLAAELVTVRERLAAVIAERDDLAKAFPIEFDVAIDNAAVIGKYKVKVSKVFGDAPKIAELTISKTPEGYLRVVVPGFVEGGLFAADGALHLVAGSTTAVPACAGIARRADVVMTLYPGAYEVEASGAATAGLNAVITVDAPASATCPAALAFATAELTRAK